MSGVPDNTAMSDITPYQPTRHYRSAFVPVRGWRYHVHEWGNPQSISAPRPLLVLLHGWMDVGASFQFMVDTLQADRFIIAPD